MENLDPTKIKKYAGYAILGIIVLVVIIFVVKYLKKTLNNKLTEVQLEHINQLEIDETQVGLPETEIQNLVAKLKTAFGNYGWGTDEDAVYDVFEHINTRSELLKLISKFGVYEDHTLPEWMTKELNNSELEHVTEILSSKGIVYSF